MQHAVKINTHVYLLCISTSFWVLRPPESWSKYFFQLFSTFFVHLKLFSVILCLKSPINMWKWMFFCFFYLLLKAGRHAKAGRLLEEVLRNCLFSIDFLLKKVWNEQKRLKTAEKSISTSFRVHTGPKSWLKYTTYTRPNEYQTEVYEPSNQTCLKLQIPRLWSFLDWNLIA